MLTFFSTIVVFNTPHDITLAGTRTSRADTGILDRGPVWRHHSVRADPEPHDRRKKNRDDWHRRSP